MRNEMTTRAVLALTAAFTGVAVGVRAMLWAQAASTQKHRFVGQRRGAVIEVIAMAARAENSSAAQLFDPWLAIIKGRPEAIGQLSALEFEDMLWDSAASAIGDPSTVAKALLDAHYAPVSTRFREFVDFYQRLPESHKEARR